MSCGTLYAVNINIFRSSRPSKRTPHYLPYLSSILSLTRPVSGPVMPIRFPPGLVNVVTGAMEEDVTTVQ